MMTFGNKVYSTSDNGTSEAFLSWLSSQEHNETFPKLMEELKNESSATIKKFLQEPMVQTLMREMHSKNPSDIISNREELLSFLKSQSMEPNKIIAALNKLGTIAVEIVQTVAEFIEKCYKFGTEYIAPLIRLVWKVLAANPKICQALGLKEGAGLQNLAENSNDNPMLPSWIKTFVSILLNLVIRIVVK